MLPPYFFLKVTYITYDTPMLIVIRNYIAVIHAVPAYNDSKATIKSSNLLGSFSRFVDAH